MVSAFSELLLTHRVQLVPMKKDWVLTQEAFDALLGWLDANRESAALKYETIRLRLVKIFVCRGCADAEDLADETINRVVSRLPEISSDYIGEPAAYFFAVSQRIHQEYLRSVRKKICSVRLKERPRSGPAIRPAKKVPVPGVESHETSKKALSAYCWATTGGVRITCRWSPGTGVLSE